MKFVFGFQLVIFLSFFALSLSSGAREDDSSPKNSQQAKATIGNTPFKHPAASTQSSPQLMVGLSKLPMRFELNKGQVDSQVRYLARGSGYTVYLTATDATLALPSGMRSRTPPSTISSSTAPHHKGEGPTAVLAGERERPEARNQVLRIKLIGAIGHEISGVEELPGKVSYLIGKDSTKWRSDIPTYAKVKYREAYPGIDLVYYGSNGKLEYDFIVAPGADPGLIKLAFEGADEVTLTSNGNLVLHTVLGQVVHHKPFTYQEIDGKRTPIASGYVLLHRHGQQVHSESAGVSRHVGFQVAAYDRSRPLFIDPVLSYSTYLGGNAEEFAFTSFVDSAGNLYLGGQTRSANFPVANAFDASLGGTIDAFVTKLDPTGSTVIYSTYLGGSLSEAVQSLVVDLAGNAYACGSTASADFPVANPIQASHSNPGRSNAFITKLNPAGSALLYSTYLGGAGTPDDGCHGIAIDSSGNAYITGQTDTNNFPTRNPIQPSHGGGLRDAYVAKINAAGSALVYSTFLGGSREDNPHAIALDPGGNAYVVGTTSSSDFPTVSAFQPIHRGGTGTTAFGPLDGFVTKVNAAGTAFTFSTFLGGTGDDQVSAVTLDLAGDIYLMGFTDSLDFPTLNPFQAANAGGFDVFVTKMNGSGSALHYSTYLGGSADEGRQPFQGMGMAVDPSGSVYVTNVTTSTDFPVTSNAIQPMHGGGVADAFVTKVPPTGSSLLFSTYLGGSGADFGVSAVLDLNGNMYVAGATDSMDFPTTSGAFQPTFGGVLDAFVAKISDVGPPATLTLAPAADTNPVGTSHTVTATVTAAGGNPVANITVRFTVTGSVSTSGSCMTDANGQCGFTYSGPDLPGADAITAYADTDGDKTQDVGEPTGGATKAWVLPVTTPLCEIKISDGGRITALNGDKATFGGNAKSSATGQTSGQQTYQDHGPAQPMTVKALSVLAIVCEGVNQASIYGQATINGLGSFFYRINLKDAGEPGAGVDTYWILLQTGYTSGQQTLEGGNVQIRRTQ